MSFLTELLAVTGAVAAWARRRAKSPGRKAGAGSKRRRWSHGVPVGKRAGLRKGK